MTDSISVLVVDDHQLFRSALSFVLRDKGFEVDHAHDATACFAALDTKKPDLVLVDLRLPGMDGVTLTRALAERAGAPKVMIVSAYAQQQDVDDAWAAGAHGYASKSHDIEQLTDGIRAIMSGERWLAPGLPEPRAPHKTRKPLSDGPLALLSARERDVFRLVVRGMTARQIAVALGIGPKTVETHRERILKKLSMHSVVELVRLAAQHQLLD